MSRRGRVVSSHFTPLSALIDPCLWIHSVFSKATRPLYRILQCLRNLSAGGGARRGRVWQRKAQSGGKGRAGRGALGMLRRGRVVSLLFAPVFTTWLMFLDSFYTLKNNLQKSETVSFFETYPLKPETLSWIKFIACVIFFCAWAAAAIFSKAYNSRKCQSFDWMTVFVETDFLSITFLPFLYRLMQCLRNFSAKVRAIRGRVGRRKEGQGAKGRARWALGISRRGRVVSSHLTPLCTLFEPYFWILFIFSKTTLKNPRFEFILSDAPSQTWNFVLNQNYRLCDFFLCTSGCC